MEGTQVHDIILDTGCSRTIVCQDLVPIEKKVPGEAVTLRCAHGDTVLYPMANVNMEVNGITLGVRTALSNTLPVLVLLGTDVPQLGQLLSVNPLTVHTVGTGEAMIVTRARAREQQRTEMDNQQRQDESGVANPPTRQCPTAIPTRGTTSWK